MTCLKYKIEIPKKQTIRQNTYQLRGDKMYKDYEYFGDIVKADKEDNKMNLEVEYKGNNQFLKGHIFKVSYIIP